MRFDVRTIGGKLIGLHCQKDLESLEHEYLVDLVNQLVSELDEAKDKIEKLETEGND